MLTTDRLFIKQIFSFKGYKHIRRWRCFFKHFCCFFDKIGLGYSKSYDFSFNKRFFGRSKFWSSVGIDEIEELEEISKNQSQIML